VVPHEHRLADAEAVADPAGRVGQRDHPAAGRHGRADAVHRGGDRVPLIQVRPPEEDEQPQAGGGH
jgi:hypothetical protein